MEYGNEVPSNQTGQGHHPLSHSAPVTTSQVAVSHSTQAVAETASHH